MKYYSDLKFLGGMHIPDCRARIDRKTPGLAVNYLAGGKIHFETADGRHETVSAPAVFWTWHSERFKYGNIEGSRWDHYWIQAAGPMTERMISEGLFPLVKWPVLRLPEDSEIPGDVKYLVSAVESGRITEHPESAWRFEGLCLKIHRLLRSGSVNVSSADIIRELAGRIDAAPLAVCDFQKEARKAGLSYSHFRRLFRIFTGLAPHDYALQRRMRLAAEKLRQGQSVKSAAAALGYGDICYFSRLFKKRMGAPPGRWFESLPDFSPVSDKGGADGG
jgi:AraC-like DNA-binding protein